VFADRGQIDEPFNLTEQVIRRHMPFEAELVKQRFLRHRPLAHHLPVSAFLADNESGRHNHCKRDFSNGIGRKRTVRIWELGAKTRHSTDQANMSRQVGYCSVNGLKAIGNTSRRD